MCDVGANQQSLIGRQRVRSDRFTPESRRPTFRILRPSTQGNDQLRKAVNYAVNQRKPLFAHLDDGRLPIHNNETERDLRHVVTGRKNWLMLGSEKGGRVAARLYPLVISCKLANVNVERYLEDVLVCCRDDASVTRRRTHAVGLGEDTRRKRRSLSTDSYWFQEAARWLHRTFP